jgi:spermidine synthase
LLAIKKDNTWKEQNLSSILNRLSTLRDSTQFEKIIQGAEQGIFLRKLDDVLEMYCFDNDTQQLSNIMSRMDLTNPLNLIGPYSQAVFLSAFWQTKAPENIYIAGFGGGRLAMLYDHYFPHSHIYGSDYDQNVLSVASDYFGVGEQTLENVNAADSREDLLQSDILHDIIFLDVFAGGGEHVNHLATVEFFELCKSKLSNKGVLSANLVIIDERMHQKIAAIQEVFAHCHVWEYNGAHVVFASEHPLEQEAFISRVSGFQTNEALDFDLMEKAQMLKPLLQDYTIQPLTDADL